MVLTVERGISALLKFGCPDRGRRRIESLSPDVLEAMIMRVLKDKI